MNVGELLDELGFVLNFNDGQTDQDFTNARLLRLLQRGYERAVKRAKQEGVIEWFKSATDITWPASQALLTLPGIVKQKQVQEVRDVTDDTVGYTFNILNSPHSFYPFWKTSSTLQWGDTGPDSDRTLRFYFYASPEKLLEDFQEPLLIPDEFHELIIWEAACIARQVADETAPPAWIQERNEMRMDYFKFVSHGKIKINTPWVSPVDTSSPDIPSQDGSSISIS